MLFHLIFDFLHENCPAPSSGYPANVLPNHRLPWRTQSAASFKVDRRGQQLSGAVELERKPARQALDLFWCQVI
jgi:hypothetical protein